MGKSFKQLLTPRPESQKDILDLTFEEKDNQLIQNSSKTPSILEDITSNSSVKQSFMIDTEYFEKLKNYVHTRRVNGEFDYTQKSALHDAMDLLFQTIVIIERPEAVIQKEKHRSEVLKSSRTRR